MSAARVRLVAAAVAVSLLAGGGVLAGQLGAPIWPVLVVAAFLAGVSGRLVVEAPAFGPVLGARVAAAARRVRAVVVDR